MEPQENNQGLELALNQLMDKYSGEFVTIRKNLTQSMSQFDSQLAASESRLMGMIASLGKKLESSGTVFEFLYGLDFEQGCMEIRHSEVSSFMRHCWEDAEVFTKNCRIFYVDGKEEKWKCRFIKTEGMNNCREVLVRYFVTGLDWALKDLEVSTDSLKHVKLVKIHSNI